MKWRKRTYDLDILEVFNFDSSVVIFELKEPNIWYLLSRDSSEARIGAGWAQAHPKISKTSYISANW
jgi:hypothetical protein